MPIITARLTLKPTPEQEILFQETAQLYIKGCNRAAELVLKNKKYQPGEIQKFAYHPLKELGLSAQHACLACRAVSAAFKIGNKSTPRTFKEDGAIPFDRRTFSLKGSVVSIWTTQGRTKVEFTCGPRQLEILQGTYKQAKLVLTSGQCLLFVSVEQESTNKIIPSGVLGVDLGIENIAVDSLGEIFSGEQVKKVRNRRAKARATFQRKGTRSAKRKLKSFSGREKRFQRWANHNVSKQIVNKARVMTLRIALEDLKGLSKKKETAHKPIRKALGGWAFYQLRTMIEYKAELAGVDFVLVKAAYSSQTCSQCDHCDKANRKSRSEFLCLRCGHNSDADLNAATNIATRGALSHPHKIQPPG